MSKFKINEVAIEIEAGKDVEILSRLLAPREYQNNSIYTNGISGYRVLFLADNTKGFVPERLLRKKKRPEETSSWEEIQKLTNWNPKKVTA